MTEKAGRENLLFCNEKVSRATGTGVAALHWPAGVRPPTRRGFGGLGRHMFYYSYIPMAVIDLFEHSSARTSLEYYFKEYSVGGVRK